MQQLPRFVPASMLAVVLASPGTVFAQSSVQIYGRINTTVEHTREGDQRSTGMRNTASRFGLLGTEDMGAGLKAFFKLESGFSSTTGDSATPYFGRGAYLGIQGPWGAIKAGHIGTEALMATADYISIHNHDTGTSADALYAFIGMAGYAKNGKLAYVTPKLAGWTVETQVSINEEAPDKVYDLAGYYDNGGPWSLGVGYSRDPNQSQYQAAFRVMYTQGAWIFGGYVQRDKNYLGPNSGTRNNYRAIMAYLLGAQEFHLNIGHAQAARHLQNSAAWQYTIGYNYNLSKRTKVYTFYTRIRNDAAAQYGVAQAGDDFSSLALGIRHNF
ncbi:Outer membrane protein (porin) [Lampropedia hyalina DSM 16112]|uniref:Outer membrane protein (Porin) n=1 Tax=Lampropedia hyalina DSM 16112 TaxID=1122156 RepID=A0A1M5DGV2_9BURK|nr:porin [Lampropedia hyalina]SHF66135.1 Outer membrane protein (porin) [Lampropedia hyalina DSM 16112]